MHDSVEGAHFCGFGTERFEGALGERRAVNIFKAAELTPAEVNVALDTTKVLYEAKRSLSIGSDAEIARQVFTLNPAITYGEKFQADYERYKTPAVTVFNSVRGSTVYRELLDRLKGFYCGCEHYAGLFSKLRTYFDQFPYLSFLTFQPVFMLVGLFSSFPMFSVYFAIPGSMLTMYDDILSCDFVSRSLRLSDDVDPRFIKVAKLLYTNRGSIVHVSFAAVAVLKDPGLVGGSFDFLFGFIKEYPVEFMRYAGYFFFRAFRNVPEIMEAPKVVVESFATTLEHASGT